MVSDRARAGWRWRRFRTETGTDALIQIAGDKAPRSRTDMLCDNPEVRHAASNQDNQSDAAFHGEVAVVVTGSTDAPTLARLAASGRPWLIKPVDLAVLHQALSRLVEPAVAE